MHDHQDAHVQGFHGASPGDTPTKQGASGAPEGYVSGGAGDVRSDQQDRDMQWEIFRGSRLTKREAEGEELSSQEN